LDSADATNTKTRSGATALSALTNRVPVGQLLKLLE